MFVARSWAAGSETMGCLSGDDVVRDAIIGVASGVFSESGRSARRLYHSTKQAGFNEFRQCSVVRLGTVSEL
jgi:hypothetical protein